jgi:hypothetical protein
MTFEIVALFLAKILAYGGGAAAVSYLLFQWLGKKWIENKFSERLEQLRHQQALELQRLRVEIDAMLSGALKLQEKEFSVLPEAWEKLNDAHGLVSWLVSPVQQFANVDRMTHQQLEEFLVSTELTKSQQDEVREAQDKGRRYQEIFFWHKLHKVKNAIAELQGFIAKNGIFLSFEIESKFSAISNKLWEATTSKQVGHEAEDWKMQRDGWDKIKNEAEPLYEEIKLAIQSRLKSHAHSDL